LCPGIVLVLRTGVGPENTDRYRSWFYGPGESGFPDREMKLTPLLFSPQQTTLRLLARFFAIATAVVSMAAPASAATASASSRLWKRFHVVDSILPRLSRMNARAH